MPWKHRVETSNLPCGSRLGNTERGKTLYGRMRTYSTSAVQQAAKLHGISILYFREEVRVDVYCQHAIRDLTYLDRAEGLADHEDIQPHRPDISEFGYISAASDCLP